MQLVQKYKNKSSTAEAWTSSGAVARRKFPKHIRTNGNCCYPNDINLLILFRICSMWL